MQKIKDMINPKSLVGLSFQSFTSEREREREKKRKKLNNQREGNQYTKD